MHPIQKYQLNLVPIGNGSFGSVHKAFRISDSHEVFLKISNNILDEPTPKFLENETEILKQISHPNIIQYFESFWLEKKFCIVMEFADGGTLQEKLGQKLSEKEILQILGQLLDGLKYLHHKKIFHLNLKPSNILFVKNQLKIVDFGMAKSIDKAIASQFTQDGSQAFMPPEMFLNKKRGSGSDIWSTGVIIYYLATQKLPFDSIEAILKLEPAPLPNVFTEEFKNLVFRMLNKNILFRPSAVTILTAIFQDFSQIAMNNTPQNIVFNAHSEPQSGILDYLTRVCYQDFLKLCQFETDNEWRIEEGFRLFSNSSRDRIYLQNEKFYEISFPQNNILLKSYSIQSEKEDFPVSWQLEGKNESEKWILIDKRENVEEMKEKENLMVFTLQKEMLISSLRLTILESTGYYSSRLKSFELFGEITQNDYTLQTLFAKPIKMDIVTPITFNFTHFTSIGLFNYFTNRSLKDRNDVFEIFCGDTKPNSTSQNLLFWNDEEWQPKSEYSVGLFLKFKFPYMFKLAGFRFRSEKMNFLKHWKLVGFESNHGKNDEKTTVLFEQKENGDLDRIGAEKSFKINSEKFFDSFSFWFNENSGGKHDFNLVGLELFGILTKAQ
jgi:serine/threonine protein kinase